jgi:hypothetical protein
MAWGKRIDRVADQMTGMAAPKKKGWSDEAREAAAKAKQNAFLDKIEPGKTTTMRQGLATARAASDANIAARNAREMDQRKWAKGIMAKNKERE